MKRSGTVMERSGTVRNGHANVHSNGQERWTLNGQERLGTLESERNNALERIVEKRSRYVHVHVSKTKVTLYLFYQPVPLFFSPFYNWRQKRCENTVLLMR
jgi:hypothetical protein